MIILFILGAMNISDFNQKSNPIESNDNYTRTLTLSFDKSSYSLKNDPYVNGTLTFKNTGPDDLYLTNNFAENKGVFINISFPNSTYSSWSGYYRKNWTDPLNYPDSIGEYNETIILKSNETLSISIAIGGIDFGHRAASWRPSNCYYSITVSYGDYDYKNYNMYFESNIILIYISD